MKFITPFEKITLKDVAEFGGKNASLGEMVTQLAPLGILLPKGFATKAAAYRQFLHENKLNEPITALLDNLQVDDVRTLQVVGHKIRSLIQAGKLSKLFKEEIEQAFNSLGLQKDQSVAVRSSATAEDLPEASFAGQHESFLNICGIEEVYQTIIKVYASLFTERAISYRVHQGYPHLNVAISVGVQVMVRSDLSASGVMFSIDTETGFDQVVFITSAYGLGEALVQGLVDPDEFYVHKPTLAENKAAIISRKCGSKKIKIIYSSHGDNPVEQIDVETDRQAQFSITDEDILALAKQAVLIEQHYGKSIDIEWAKDGITGELYIVQARPETVCSHADTQVIKQFKLQERGPILTSGHSVGQQIGKGTAKCVTNAKDMQAIEQGDILVTDHTDPDWEPIMKRTAAIVTNRGGRTCHAAIVARELGIPALVGCGDATEKIAAGEAVTVSCAEGETGFVYQGLLDYHVAEHHIAQLPEIPVKLCMNLANPEQAFYYQFLPNEGIGLARVEFIISNMIGIHPNAVLHFDELNQRLQLEILQKTAAYASPKEFYIEKLSEGISTLAAAFYPKQVIVRFSDFKSNEYANLLGGLEFEPKEENPMLGLRGAARYLSTNFHDCFVLECEAIKRVRNVKGLSNVHVMFPFVRTVEEAHGLVKLTKTQGLERGVDGLKLYMMCEIPSNAILAEDFLQYFDGFSIGSNDLTQLTLGLDRDSELVASAFDERNEAVKVLLSQVIKICKKHHKYVGICGQGPSDYIDFAKWLLEQGITSISLNPDSILKTWLALGEQNA